MKNRYIVSLLLGLLLFCVYMLHLTYEDAKNKAITELNSRQMILAKHAKNQIEFYFNSMAQFLDQLAASDHIVTFDDKGRQEMDVALTIRPEGIKAITRVNERGKIIYTTPVNDSLIGRDISGQKHVTKILKTQSPVASDVFNAVQGYQAIAVHVPVFKGKDFKGTLAVLIDFLSISRRSLQSIRIGETGYAWMTSREGIELFCPVPGHTGNSIFETCKNFPTILAMAENMLQGRQGITTYQYDKIREHQSETIKKHAVYLPIKIVDSFWTIVVASSENEVLATLVGFKNKLIIIMGLLLLCSSFFSYFSMKAWGIVREETERKKAEKALLKSEERFRSLVESMNEWVWEVDPEGTYQYASPQVFDLLGYKPAEILGKTFSDFIIPEDKDRVAREVNSIIANPRPFENLEKRYFHKKGHIVFLEASGVPIIDEEGNLTGFKGINRNITERKKAEREVQQLNQFRKSIIENANIWLNVLDEAGNVVVWNKAAETISGYSKEEVVGHNKIWEWAYPDKNYRNKIFTQVTAIIQDNKVVEDFETTIRRKDGKDRIIAWHSRNLKSEKGKPIGSIALGRDITDRKLAVKEKTDAQKVAADHKELALVGQIAGKMAHDFNNILGIIMGNAELSLLNCKEPNVKETLELIFDQTLRGKNLTKNLVAFAKSQEPKQEFFKISSKINLVLSLLKKDLEGIEIVRDDKPGVPELLADPGMIEHALVNLVLNSIHAVSTTSNPAITIRTYCLAEKICFEIEDNGCGIPKEHISDIYAPSFTLKGSNDLTGAYEPGIKGTGYGMANVKKYIDQHKGNILAESKMGHSTKFTIQLPVIKKELTIEEAAEIEDIVDSNGKYILLVEDEPAISDVQYTVLTHPPCNYRVDIANTGQIAMDLFDRNDYDFVSLDYILPRQFNGMDVYNHIRTTNQNIPILFVSGNIEFLESIKQLKGKDTRIDHISKPCSNVDYIKMINRLLK